MFLLGRIVIATAFLIITSCCLAVGDKVSSYVTNTAKGKHYYHLMFSLVSENLELIDKLTKAEFYENGGQFEVRILQDEFPIRAPNCKSNIILRMPWVEQESSLGKKYELYKSILFLYESRGPEKIDVSIELNPYVGFDKDGIYLTQCNVFFRHKDGRYIPNVEP